MFARRRRVVNWLFVFIQRFTLNKAGDKSFGVSRTARTKQITPTRRTT
jgi:hypothetical protein